VAVAELVGRPVVVFGSSDGIVRVWDLATGRHVGKPFTGHTGRVLTVAVAELDGRQVVVSGSSNGTVRVWDLAARRAVRHHLRPVRLRHPAPVLVAVTMQHENRVCIITGCLDKASYTWELPSCRKLSRTIIEGRFGNSAITILAPDNVLYANGATMSLYDAVGAPTPRLTIELDAEIQAFATHGTSTVIAATRRGLIAFEIPRQQT
jgi:WD40 repeat protein